MNLIKTIVTALNAIPYSLIALFLRIVAAHPFFVSGQTKIEGPTLGGEIFGVDLSFQIPTALRAATFALFADEYKVPLVSPTVAAYAASTLEFVLPVLLFIGLLTRLSTFGLLIMTLVIQIFVFPDAWWTVHAYWMAILLVLFARGAGVISLDHLLFSRWSTKGERAFR